MIITFYFQVPFKDDSTQLDALAMNLDKTDNKIKNWGFYKVVGSTIQYESPIATGPKCNHGPARTNFELMTEQNSKFGSLEYEIPIERWVEGSEGIFFRMGVVRRAILYKKVPPAKKGSYSLRQRAIV